MRKVRKPSRASTPNTMPGTIEGTTSCRVQARECKSWAGLRRITCRHKEDGCRTKV